VIPLAGTTCREKVRERREREGELGAKWV